LDKRNLLDKVTEEEWSQMHTAMLDKQVLPSMRIVQMAGPALHRCNVGAYNCSFLAIDDPNAFVELLYVLMQGTGVGFSVENMHVQNLPVVAKQTGAKGLVHVVEDSTEGWCRALGAGIASWWIVGDDIEFDYSRVRAYGAPLKTKGGRASGPEPLKNLLTFVRKLLLSHQGKRLSSLNCHDIACYIGSIVQVGGVRRAAEISLSDLSDEKMRRAKQGEFWHIAPERAMSNNSVVYDTKPSMTEFFDEWRSLMLSGSGERGIFNREGYNKHQRPQRRWPIADYGLNPCFAQGTLIETVNGRIPIEKLTTKTKVYTMLANGELGIRSASASWKTKQSATLTLVVGNYKLRVTPEHKIYSATMGQWVEARALMPGDRVVAIQRVRRGARYCGVKLSSSANYQMEHRLVWEGTYGPLLPGWDVHHENEDTYDNRLSNLRPMPHEHHSHVTAMEQPNDHQVKGVGGKFVGDGPRAKVIVPLPPHLKAGIHQYATIERIDYHGELVDVYDLKVEDTHNVIADGIVAHNCGEIVLRNRQFCNLSIAVARPEDGMTDLIPKVRLATMFGILQSLLTDFSPMLSPHWKANCEDERLLGVDITGQCDNVILRGSHAAHEYHMLKLAVLSEASKLSLRFGINMPAATTCVKPSGNSSQLLDTSSGIHPRYAEYYIRRIRLSTTNPVARMLKDAGVPCFPENGQAERDATIHVFEFPVKSPEGAKLRKHVTAIKQLDHWMACKANYTEHNPSITVYIRPDEWMEVGAWVYKNWNMVGGISFLPYDGGVYMLPPYEECTKAEYEKRVQELPSFENFSEELQKYEHGDQTELNREFACTGDRCEL
jgi:hypothetical protein